MGDHARKPGECDLPVPMRLKRVESWSMRCREENPPGLSHHEEVMAFSLPPYTPPKFQNAPLSEAPHATFVACPADGVAPENFHATSNHPEYYHLADGWNLLRDGRMDAVAVLSAGEISAVEARRLRAGQKVCVGRTENGEEGVFVHTEGFNTAGKSSDKFAFRTRGTRETPFSRSYDDLYEQLRYERDHGKIVWVAGPAVSFDKDSRDSFAALIDAGFCHALLAGNAVCTHDIEAGFFGTGLGQDIYDQRLVAGGHYHHLDILNRVRRAGSIRDGLSSLGVTDGITAALERNSVPYVLAGSIRDDGPLPGVISDVYEAQDRMREEIRSATAVVSLATQLHSIAVGNMLPSYTVTKTGVVRPVYLTVVDITEFSVDKLANRGTAQATAIVTNVQDFMIHLRENLTKGERRA
jgi:lysine-ketoglutarate reductase/saccharopine dehydrogenase-like protein (TIGR00300 family)